MINGISSSQTMKLLQTTHTHTLMLPVTTAGCSRCELLSPSCVVAAGQPLWLRVRTAQLPGLSWQLQAAQAHRPADTRHYEW